MASVFHHIKWQYIPFLLSLTWNMIWRWRYDPCEYTRARLWKQQGRKSWPLWYWPRDNHMSYINTAHRGLDIYWIFVLGILSGPSQCKKEFYRYRNPLCKDEIVLPLQRFRDIGIGIPIIKIRRSHNRFSFIMGILYREMRCLYWKRPRCMMT